MRKRLTPEHRKSDIQQAALKLFLQRGFSGTEMEDIRHACGISRGGLYHHFKNKAAILDALVASEVGQLATMLKDSSAPPIESLLEAGSSHLGNDTGVLAAMGSPEEKVRYLASLERAVSLLLSPILGEKLVGYVREGVDPAHVAELFLIVNSHINRRHCLGDWTERQGASFAATALHSLAPLLKDTTRLDTIIATLQKTGSEN